MKNIRVTMPDGKSVKITVDDALTDEQIGAEVEAVTADYMAQSQPQEAPNGMQEADQAQAPVKRGETYTERLAQGTDKLQRAAFPRLTDLGRFNAVEGLKDVASLPGRTLMGMLSAYDQGQFKTRAPGEQCQAPKSLSDRVLESAARVESSSNELMPRFLSNVARDPLTAALPVVSRAVPLLTNTVPFLRGASELSRPSMAIREGAQGVAQGVASGYGMGENGSFSPTGAALGAVGVAPGAVKVVADAPAWARVRTPTGVVDDLIRNQFNPSTSLRRAESYMFPATDLEKLAFQSTEFGPPMMRDVRDLQGFGGSLMERMGQIGEKRALGLSADEFSTPIANLDVISAPVVGAQNAGKEVLQLEREAMQDAGRLPFFDLFSKYNAPVRAGGYQDRGAVNDAYDLIASGAVKKESDRILNSYEEAPLFKFGDSIEARDVVKTRSDLLKRAKKLGKYEKQDKKLSDEADAYLQAYDELGNVIKREVPLTSATAPFYEAQKQFAQTFPWEKAASDYLERAWANKRNVDQTLFGRWSLDNLAKAGKSSALKSMPEVVTFDNAFRLYNKAPSEQMAQQLIRSRGSAGTGVKGESVRQIPNTVRIYKSSEKDEK